MVGAGGPPLAGDAATHTSPARVSPFSQIFVPLPVPSPLAAASWLSGSALPPHPTSRHKRPRVAAVARIRFIASAPVVVGIGNKGTSCHRPTWPLFCPISRAQSTEIQTTSCPRMAPESANSSQKKATLRWLLSSRKSAPPQRLLLHRAHGGVGGLLGGVGSCRLGGVDIGRGGGGGAHGRISGGLGGVNRGASGRGSSTNGDRSGAGGGRSSSSGVGGGGSRGRRSGGRCHRCRSFFFLATGGKGGGGDDGCQDE